MNEIDEKEIRRMYERLGLEPPLFADEYSAMYLKNILEMPEPRRSEYLRMEREIERVGILPLDDSDRLDRIGDILEEMAGFRPAYVTQQTQFNKQTQFNFDAKKPVETKKPTNYTPEEARNRVDSKNSNSPLHKIVGNEDAVSLLSWILYDALANEGHICTQNLAFVGPSSSGKTMISRIFAEVLDVPHIEIGPKMVSNAGDIIKTIYDSLTRHRVGVKKENGVIVLPSMVILLDEAQAFPDAIIQVLLKATERNDGILSANGTILDCRNVCWHFATTDLGKIFDAFITRFEQVALRLYTKDEIASIIQKNNPAWDKSVCLMIANYCNRIPREALAFAELVRKFHSFDTNASWEDATAAVAKKKGIDEYGMTIQRLNILRALGQRPMSVNQLCATAVCKEEELRRLVLPWLLEATSDQPPYVTVTNRHYITKEGLAELDKRGIAHKGEAVLCTFDRGEEN